jgi:hypothetical protein
LIKENNMKIRSDYVSNSSSSSFIIENPGVIKGKKDALQLLGNAQYVSFNGVNCKKDFGEFEKKLQGTFGEKVEIEAYDGPEDVYVSIDPDDWTTEDKAIPVIGELIDRCKSMCLNFGDCYDDGGKATQVATLLDYLYGVEICPEDHFDYDPVTKLGIVPLKEQK